MSNVVRLINGGTVQVRTGVLQGVGPEGPRGQRGLPGPDGPQGPTGDTGPMGQILQIQMRANVSATTTVNPDTDTLVAFGTVLYDDMGAATSSTNFTLAEIGDYLLSSYLRFDLPGNAGDGQRELWYASSTMGTIARKSVPAVTDGPTYVDLTFPYRCTTADEVLNVYVRSGDDLAVGVTAGAFALNRIGSGPRGLTGPAGEQGPPGATGVQGPPGPAGSASSGFATYGDITP